MPPRARSLLLLATSCSLLLACGDKKEKAWWEKSDACPDGASIERNGSDVFCAIDGVKHGRFESTNADGKVALLSGAYKNGKRDGTWTQRTPAGQVLGSYQLAEGTGTVSVWRDDGSVETEAQYVGDVLAGSWARFNAPAESASPFKLEEGQYDSGKAIGKWTFREEAGQVIREVEYRAGEIWETRYFENGELARLQLSAAAQAEADQRAKELAAQAARNAGLLGVLSQQQGSAFASLTGSGSFSSGLDDKNIYGGLLGNEVGDMQGGFGYGVKGTGPGGGGTGWGTIGTGRYGQIGKGDSAGIGYGTGSGRLSGRRAAPPQLRMGATTATGSLDKNIIRRYIRRQARAFRTCYEKELSALPKLQGTVVLQFTIGASGAVMSAKASGLGNKKVQSCVARKARTIRFPKPKGGGNVVVRVPFTLRPGKPATKPASKPATKPTGSDAAPKKPALKGGGAVKRRED